MNERPGASWTDDDDDDDAPVVVVRKHSAAVTPEGTPTTEVSRWVEPSPETTPLAKAEASASRATPDQVRSEPVRTLDVGVPVDPPRTVPNETASASLSTSSTTS